MDSAEFNKVIVRNRSAYWFAVVAMFAVAPIFAWHAVAKSEALSAIVAGMAVLVGTILVLRIRCAVRATAQPDDAAGKAPSPADHAKTLDGREREPTPIAHKALLVDALGYWPSFHDARVLSAVRNGDSCEVLLYVFHMTDQVDENGYFVLTKHHRVRLWMTGVSECSLPAGYEGDTLFELLVKESGGTVTVTFDSVTDQSWQVICQEVGISDVVPCGPRGAAI